MQVVNYSEARNNLKSLMEAAAENHEDIIVTRKNARPVVIISLDELNSLRETDYLLSNPKTAKRLVLARDRMNKGKGVEHELIDP